MRAFCEASRGASPRHAARRPLVVITLALSLMSGLGGTAASDPKPNHMEDSPLFNMAMLVLSGTALIGDHFDNPCSKDGFSIPEGEGMYIPHPSNVLTATNKEHVWMFGTSSLRVIYAADAKGLPPEEAAAAAKSGDLQACGRMKGVGRWPLVVGASCGMSKGYQGMGTIDV